ncbi:groucho protein [Sarcoptes scabiei]|nr:groucho protein [Sarcoptes scabiei]
MRERERENRTTNSIEEQHTLDDYFYFDFDFCSTLHQQQIYEKKKKLKIVAIKTNKNFPPNKENRIQTNFERVFIDYYYYYYYNIRLILPIETPEKWLNCLDETIVDS